MHPSDASQGELPATPESGEPRAQELRIDGPHPIEAELRGSSVGGLAQEIRLGQDPAVIEELQVEAAQLAVHLRTRQRTLDHRESEVNARLAQLEQEARSTTLWFSERQSDLVERLAAVERREHEADETYDRLAAAEVALENKAAAIDRELAEREQFLAQREAAVELRAVLLREEADRQQKTKQELDLQRQQAEAAIEFERQQIATQREASLAMVRQALAGLERYRSTIADESQAVPKACNKGDSPIFVDHASTVPAKIGTVPEPDARQEEFRRAEAALLSRWQELDEAETEMAAELEQIRKLRREMIQRQQEIEATAHAERRQLALEHRNIQAQGAKQRQAFADRNADIDRRQAKIQAFQERLERVHCETLEIRLATEELWKQLCGAVPPARLSPGLAAIRAKLHEHYRVVREGLAAQKAELVAIRAELAAQHTRLTQEILQFDERSNGRRRELDQMADDLSARHAQLDRRDAQMAEQLHSWEIERVEYRQELRRAQRVRSRASEELAAHGSS